MRVFANGREVEVPADNDGNVDVVQVRRAANIPDDRDVIRQMPEGANALIPKRGNLRVNPYDRFMDISRAKRGELL
jgi:hypothetical protein